MYKSTCKAESYRGRIADYSTVGFARGIFIQLPDISKRFAVERTEIRRMLEILKSESARLSLSIQHNKHDSDEVKRLTETKCRIDGKLGSLEKYLKEIKAKQFESVFAFVSEMFLNQESLHALRNITTAIVNELCNQSRTLYSFKDGEGI